MEYKFLWENSWLKASYWYSLLIVEILGLRYEMKFTLCFTLSMTGHGIRAEEVVWYC